MKGIEFKDRDRVKVVTSSPWAERGFCDACGSSLFYRITAEGQLEGMTSISLGSLDDQSGIALSKEFFIDRKPDVYNLEGDRQRLTEAEVMAMFGG